MATFVKIAKTAEVEPGCGKSFEVNGKRIALFNVEGPSTPSMILVLIGVGRFRKGISMGIKLPVHGMGLYLM